MIRYLIWGIIAGTALLAGFTIYLFRSGWAFRARESDGTLKGSQDLKGKCILFLSLLCMVAFLVVLDAISFHGKETSFQHVLFFNSLVFGGLMLIDALLIDLLVLGYWKPAFLRIPETVTFRSMARHVAFQLSIGWLVAAGIVTLSASLFLLLQKYCT